MSETTKNNTPIEEDDEIIEMTFDDGTKENCYLLAELDYEGKWYAYLEPVDPPEEFEEGDVYVYEVEEDEAGNEIFLPVEDDNLLEILVEKLNEEIE